MIDFDLQGHRQVSSGILYAVAWLFSDLENGCLSSSFDGMYHTYDNNCTDIIYKDDVIGKDLVISGLAVTVCR